MTISLGHAIKLARESRGLSQGDLEEKTGISRNHLSLIENDKVEPRITTLVQLGGSIGIPAWKIMRRFETPYGVKEVESGTSH